MSKPTPLTFTDEQLVAAVKAAPEAVQSQILVVAMQLELLERREQDDADS